MALQFMGVLWISTSPISKTDSISLRVTVALEVMIKRSMIFLSSRIFPGHVCRSRASIAPWEKTGGTRFMAQA